MKNTYLHISIFCIIFIGMFSIVHADWISPSGVAPLGGISPAISSGSQYQIKSGDKASLSIFKYSTNNATPFGFSFYSDTGSGVDHPYYRSGYPEWFLDGNKFAFDTNAPIYTTDIFSTGRILTLGNLESKTIRIKGLIGATNTQTESSLCGNIVSGDITICNIMMNTELTVSLTASVSNITAEVPTRVSLEWESNGTRCYPLSGLGFSTLGNTMGRDTSNPITLPAGDTEVFGIACIDGEGNSKTDFLEINANSLGDAVPILTIHRLDPDDTCLLNPVIMLSGSNMVSGYPIKIQYSIAEESIYDHAIRKFNETITIPAGQSTYERSLFKSNWGSPVQSQNIDQYFYTVNATITQTNLNGTIIKSQTIENSARLDMKESNDIC